MFTFLLSIIGILITILVVVGVHEFGHFIVARILHVKVLRFSIGFGKILYRKQDKKGTEYAISAIPLGGYVKMLDDREDPVSIEEQPFTYHHQPFYKKLAIVVAGPVFNLLFALIIYWMIFMIGFSTITPIIGSVLPDSPAAKAGLASQQEIIRIDEKETKSWISVVITLILRAGEHGELKIDTKNRTSQQIQSHLVNLQDWHLDDLKPNPLASLGIVPFEPPASTLKNYLRNNQYTVVPAFFHAWEETKIFCHLNFILIGKLIVGKISLQSLGGPITIFESAGNAFIQGLIPFLSFLAFLSISIGLINILPIPGLDGGHILIEFIEFVIRRPLSMRVQLLIDRLGIIVLLLIITQAIINDVFRLSL